MGLVDITVFDFQKEKELLDKLKACKNNLELRHFVYIELQDFYYKYRKTDGRYLNLCVEYCLKDITTLATLNSYYIREKTKEINKYAHIRQTPKEDREEIEELNKRGFMCYIPAFKRIAIIYENKKDYSSAISYCDKAIDYYRLYDCPDYAKEFEERKEKLIKKRDA